MPATYEPIATQTLGTAAASITFSSIPATYTDLRLVIVAKEQTNSGSVPLMRFNSDSATNYSFTEVYGTGSAAQSYAWTGRSYIYISGISNLSSTVPTFYDMDIFSYAGSTNKTVLNSASTDLNGSGNVERMVQLWRNTAVINRIDILISGGNTYAAGTTATLYGIKAA